jgi:hypothetical protein
VHGVLAAFTSHTQVCFNPAFEQGATMANRRKTKARKTKAKGSMVRSKPRKKALARAASRKKKTAATTKRPAKKMARKHASGPKKRQQRRRPVVEDRIVDVIDEPFPGVVRVTEIEEVSVKESDGDDDK